nr:winged helix-turn-helix domain-containing protein [Gallaecimonas xiamenensis]
MPAVLVALADGKERPLREVYEQVCQHYAFTPEQLAQTLPSGRQSNALMFKPAPCSFAYQLTPR